MSLASCDVARRLLLPGIKVFLDIDDLDNTDHLERYIEQSQTVLIFLSKGYFFSKNCLRELDCALAKGKPLILVHEADLSHGGASLTNIKAECESKQRMQVFEPRDDEDGPGDSPVQPRDVITWQRVSDFQLVCMREICAAILHATPAYEKLLEPPDLFVPGELSFQTFTFPHHVKLHVSPHNPGAWALAEEFKEHCDSWQQKRSIAAQSKTLEIEEGLRARHIDTTTSPPPSPPNVDLEEVVGVDNPTTAGQVARVELPPDDGSAQALAPRKLVYPQQNVDQSTVPQAPAFLSKLKGWGTMTNLDSGYQVRHVKATHFLLYLNKDTFVGEEGAKLAEEVNRAMDSWLPIVLVHEEDPDFNGCPFDELYHNTPEDLINQGLYKKIAISCKPGSLRRVSLSLIAKALGAVPVLTRFEEIVHSPSRALDSARRSMKTGAAEMRSKMRSSSGSITSPEGSSSVSTRLGGGLSSVRRSLSVSMPRGNRYPSSVSASDVHVETEASILVKFESSPLGIGLKNSADEAAVSVIVQTVDEDSVAMKQGVRVGATVTELNGKSVVGKDKRAVIDEIKSCGFPLTLRFDVPKASGVSVQDSSQDDDHAATSLVQEELSTLRRAREMAT